MTFMLSPGCCCSPVEAGCEVLNDPFDRPDSDTLGGTWTELSGDVDIAGNLAVVASGVTGRAISSTTYLGNIRITMDILAGGLGTSFRILLGYTDANNFLYATATINFVSTVKVFIREAGVDTELASQNQTMTTGVTYEFFACFRSGLFAAGITGGNTAASFVFPSFPFGSSFGFQIAAVSGDASINDYLATKVQDGCDDCVVPDEVLCASCVDGVIPRYFLVTLAGFLNDWCTDCGMYNTSFIIGMGATSCSGSVLYPGQARGAAPCGNFDNSGFGSQTQVNLAFLTGPDRIVVTVSTVEPFPTAPIIIAQFTLNITTPYDCVGINGLDIPLSDAGHADSFGNIACDASGATCTITAL